MLDITYIRENRQAVEENARDRGMTIDLDRTLELDEKRRELTGQTQELRQERNENSQKMKGPMEPDERAPLIERGKEIKESIARIEEELDAVTADLRNLLRQIPNMTHPDVPVGGEEDAREIEKVGTPRDFDFEPLDHLELGARHNLLDFERAASVAGSSFYFLKNEGALLELALVNFAVETILKHGYAPHITPDLARPDILDSIGFNPRGEESQVYSIDGHDLCLIGTAEITLGGMHAGEIIPKEDLPIRLGGYSHCFRTEAGAHGRESRGLYRVHQFSKVEMFAFCAPEESEQIHEEMLAIEKEIFSALEIPYRVVDIATGDLGAPAYRKYDIEAWMPSRNTYGEVTSTSNCTDFQARRLEVRTRDDENRTRFLHTLNGTAIAVPRAIIAVLENGQQADGSITLPKVLSDRMGTGSIG